ASAINRHEIGADAEGAYSGRHDVAQEILTRRGEVHKLHVAAMIDPADDPGCDLFLSRAPIQMEFNFLTDLRAEDFFRVVQAAAADTDIADINRFGIEFEPGKTGQLHVRRKEYTHVLASFGAES